MINIESIRSKLILCVCGYYNIDKLYINHKYLFHYIVYNELLLNSWKS